MNFKRPLHSKSKWVLNEMIRIFLQFITTVYTNVLLESILLSQATKVGTLF